MALPNLSRDYRELLLLFAKHRVRYLVVGAYAVNRYTEPRYTKDIDLWIDRSSKNAQRAYRALAEYGAPLGDYTSKDFMDRNSVFQIGIEPVRVDVLTSIAGVRFETAWANKTSTMVGGMRIHFISKPDLIKAKKAAGRKQDLIDLDALEGKS